MGSVGSVGSVVPYVDVDVDVDVILDFADQGPVVSVVLIPRRIV